MKKLYALAFTISAAACGHEAKPATTPAPPLTSTTMSSTPTEDPIVDPTLPSWAPRTCVAYHAAVVRFVECEADDAAKRDTVRQAYDSDTKRWHNMENVEQKAIDDIRTSCAASADEVRKKTDPNCPGTTTIPDKS